MKQEDWKKYIEKLPQNIQPQAQNLLGEIERSSKEIRTFTENVNIRKLKPAKSALLELIKSNITQEQCPHTDTKRTSTYKKGVEHYQTTCNVCGNEKTECAHSNSSHGICKDCGEDFERR